MEKKQTYEESDRERQKPGACRTEETRRADGENYRLLFENMVQGVLFLGADGAATDANAALSGMLGVARDELIGKTFADIGRKVIHEDGTDFPCEDQPSTVALRTGMPVRNVIAGVFNPQKNDYVWMRISAMPLFKPGEKEPGQVFATFHDITLRKRSERIVHENENTYRDIINSMSDIVYIFSDRRGCLYCSPSVGTVLGYSPESLCATPFLWHELIHPEDKAAVMQAITGAGFGKPFSVEYRIRDALGNWRWLNDRSVKEHQSTGETFIKGIARDITRRKNAEARLREQEAVQHLLISLATGFINVPLKQIDSAINEMLGKVGASAGTDRAYIFKFDHTRCLAVNTHEWRADGISSETANLQAVPFDLLSDVMAACKRGEPYHIPCVAEMPSADPLRAHLEAQQIQSLLVLPMVHEGRLCAGLVGFDAVRKTRRYTETEINLLRIVAVISANILERQRIEEELYLFRTVTETSNEAIAISDPDGNLLYINPAHEKLFGRSFDEAKTINYREYYPPESLSVLNQQVVPLLQQGKSWEGVLDAFDAGGRRFPLWERAGSIFDDQKNMLCSFGFMHDDTERKQYEKHLRESEEKYRLLFDNAGDLIIIHDEDARILEANKLAADLLGYTREELKSMRIFQIDSPEQSHHVPERIAKIMAQGCHTFETDLRRRDGLLIPTEVKTRRIVWEGRPALMSIGRDITERRRAEEAIRDQSTRLKNIIEGTHAGTWEWNVRTGETVFNETWANIAGYTLGELSPVSIRTWEMLTHPDDLKQSFELLNRHFAGELPYYDCDLRMKHKEGHWVWIHDRGRIVTRDADGSPLLMFGTHIDISERKRAEEAMKKSENRFRQLFESTPVSIWEEDFSVVKQRLDELQIQDGEDLRSFFLNRPELVKEMASLVRVVNVNQATLKLYRAQSKEVFYAGIPQIFAPESYIGFIDALLTIMNRGTELYAEKTHMTLDGQIMDIQLYWTAAPGYEDTYKRVLVSIVDITERKRAEENVRASEQRLKLAQRIAKMGDFTWDADTGEITWSEGMSDMLGYDPSEKFDYARVNAEIHHPEDLGRVTKWLNDCIGTGARELVPNEYRLICRDKTVIYVRTIGIIERNEDKHVRVFAAIQDITEIKEAEAQIRRLQKAESLSRMAGAVAHHYNNMLFAVMGNMELAMDALPEDSGSFRYLTESMIAARRASGMGGMMLSYLGQTVIRKEPLNITDTCRRFLEDIRAEMPAHVTLNTDLPEPDMTVTGNADQIRQMLHNLIVNAWEAIGDAPGVVSFRLRRASPEEIPSANRHPLDFHPEASGYARLEAADTGCGITENNIEKLFDPFFTTKFIGRGLGLPLVLGAVKAHEGCIASESAPGKGSVFRVFLPVTTA